MRTPTRYVWALVVLTWSAAALVAIVGAWRRDQHLTLIRAAHGYPDLFRDPGWARWSTWAWALLGVAWLCLLAGQVIAARQGAAAGASVGSVILYLIPGVGLIAWLVARVRRSTLPGGWLLGAWALVAAVLMVQVTAPVVFSVPREVAAMSPAADPADQINPDFRAAVLADAERTLVPARGIVGAVLVTSLALLSIKLTPSMPVITRRHHLENYPAI